jgi:hypothetical protein
LTSYLIIDQSPFFIHREMVVVHPDNDFLEDITGKLKEVLVNSD